jgi:beta-phosphoglucomutase-like phosphatase (HAD superfamily)
MNCAIILDMDGVIIDSNPFHRMAWKEFLERHGVTVNEHMFRNVIFGTTGDQAIRNLLQPPDITAEQLSLLTEEIDTSYRSIISGSEQIFPVDGLYNFLDFIKEIGFKIALATSAPPENISLILERLGITEYFDVIVDKTQVTNGKPDPEVYLKTMENLKTDSKYCLVFEDSLSGVRSAIQAGIRVIGVTTSHTAEELSQAGTFYNIDDFNDPSLPELLATISAY